MASLLLLPRNCVSLGASGAVFGLFTLSVLIKLAAGFQPKKLVEAAILGQFVLTQLQQEVCRVVFHLRFSCCAHDRARTCPQNSFNRQCTSGTSVLCAGPCAVCADRWGSISGH